jgi:hypothetical protein
MSIIAVVVGVLLLLGMVAALSYGGGNPSHKDHNPTGGWGGGTLG